MITPVANFAVKITVNLTRLKTSVSMRALKLEANSERAFDWLTAAVVSQMPDV